MTRCGRVRVPGRAARSSARRAGGAAGGRRGGPGGADDRPAAVERAGPVCVSVRPGGHRRAPQPGAGQPGCPPAGRAAWPGRGAADPHAPHAAAGAARPPRSTRCGRRCGPTATGPWSMRWCWAGCAAARCSGLRLEDLSAGERRLFVAEGKGGRQRIVPVSARFFAALGAYLESERPASAATRQVFVVLKGARRGEPLSAAGLDEILDGARGRAGLDRATCHQLRHTCFTRLREAGMALEAIQAQAGHASIESTRIYLHLANDWLEKEYLRAAEAIEAQAARSAGEHAGERVTGPAPRRRGPGRRLPRRPGRRRDVRRAPGHLGGPHVLHPGRRRRVGPPAAGSPVRLAAQGPAGGRLADRDRAAASQPRLPGGLPSLPRRGRRPPSPGVPRAVRRHLRRARLRPRS